MSTLNTDELYAAVGSHLAIKGSVTLQDIVKTVGCSIGSLYHHYQSREGLLAAAWLDAATTFQGVFLTALSQSGQKAALATPRFCRTEKAKAVILACCRKSEFLNDNTPAQLRKDIEMLNKKTEAHIRIFAEQSGHSLEDCLLSIVAFPLGAVRLYLPARDVPVALDMKIARAYDATLPSR